MNKSKKFKHRKIRVGVLPKVDMSYVNAATINLRQWDKAHVIVAGCGGSGSFLVQHIGRIMRAVREAGKGIHLTLVDPDVVEEINIGRQLFCAAEIGVPKAEALARRYGQAWGLNVSTYVGKYDDSLVMDADLTLLVGCVDGHEGRKALHQTLEANPVPEFHLDPNSIPIVWYLDCGNLAEFGRVLLGSGLSYEHVRGAFPVPELCIALPSPGLQCPDLLIPQPEDEEESGMSCAELAAANLQSLNINAAMAVEASDFITRLLVTKDLQRFACEVNLAAGVRKSYYVTPETVAESIHKPAGFVRSFKEAS